VPVKKFKEFIMTTGSEVKKKVSPPKRATGDWWKGRKLLDNKNKTKVGTGSSGPSTRQSNKPTKAPSTPNTPKAPSTPNTANTSKTPKAPSTSTSQGNPRSIAEAKKMGKDYFVGKDGKRKAAVSAEELKASGMSLRDYLNKQQGKTRKSD
jgi:hypothetical protein